MPGGRVWQEKQAPELEGWKRVEVNEQVAGFPTNTELVHCVPFVHPEPYTPSQRITEEIHWLTFEVKSHVSGCVQNWMHKESE